MQNFMSNYVNPPCKSSLATSFIILIKKLMSSSGRENEVGRRSQFAGDVVEEGALQIDERDVEESVSPVPPFLPNLNVAEIEGVECVRRVLVQLSSEAIENTERVLERDDDNDDDGNDSFVDVVGDKQADEGAVSEDFTFAEALMRANLLSKTVLEGDVGSSELPLC